MNQTLLNALSLKEEIVKSGFTTSEGELLATGEIFAAFIKQTADITVQIGLISPPNNYTRLVLIGTGEDLETVMNLLKGQNLCLSTMPGLTLADCLRMGDVEEEPVISLSACPQIVAEYARQLPVPASKPLAEAADNTPAVAQDALTL